MRLKNRSTNLFRVKYLFRARNNRIMLFASLAIASGVLLLAVMEWQSALAQVATSTGAKLPASLVGSDDSNISTAHVVPHAEQGFQQFDKLLEKARIKGTVALIVGLHIDFKPEGYLRTSLRINQRAEIARRQESLLSTLEPFAPSNIVKFQSISYLAMTVNAETLEFLKTLPEVKSVREDEFRKASLAESTQIVEAPQAWSAGYSGQGQVIAILDTGVDKNHPFLSGKVISEACFSATDPQRAGTTLCPGGSRESTAPNSAMPCTLDAKKGCEHGTHVAGIAAGKLPSGNLQGVAKDAHLVAIQVFLRVDDPQVCREGAPCIRVSDKDYMRALEYVLNLKQSGMNIAAANLSLGDGVYTERCDSRFQDLNDLVTNLQTANVATVVASGNGDENGNGYANAISAPACISSAISVGSTWDGSGTTDESTKIDGVARSSNSVYFLNLLAPGEWITSSTSNGEYKSMPGTSMAAPHVAGAWAVIKQRAPNASVPEVLDALRNTGKPIPDTKNSIATRRIRIHAALQAIQNCSFSLPQTSQSAAATGGSGSFNFTVPAGCEWVATSTASWLTTSASGIGSGTVNFNVAASAGSARTGSITVGGKAFTVSQAASGMSIEQFKVAAPDGVANDLLGTSVAVSGDTAIVGAPGDDVGANTDQGSAYVFVRNASGTWSQQAKLIAGGGAAGDEFGWSVALEGNTAVVGARSHDVGARPNQGAAYVFVRSGTTWTQQAELTSPADTSAGVVEDDFGESVAIFGNRIVVGSPGYESLGLSGLLHVGAAYIFERSGTNWIRREQKIQGLLFAKAGRSVATTDFTFQGSTISVIAVGCPQDGRGNILGQPSIRPGSVRFYTPDAASGIWFERERFIPIEGGDGDEFGDSLAIATDGTTLISSRFAEVDSTSDRGATYILVPTPVTGGVTWTQQAKLIANDGATNDQFGTSVGISGNIAIVGARYADITTNQNRGAAYIFEREGTAWSQRRKLLAEDGAALDEFGTRVGVSNGTAIVGAAAADARRGSAYIFSLLPPAPTAINLSQANYFFGEGTGHANFTVRRTGDTSGAVALEYRTTDQDTFNVGCADTVNNNGGAFARCDFATSVGTLQFNAGETSKTIIVPLIDDAHAEGAETFQLRLSNVSGAVLGSINVSTITIQDNDVAGTPNPVMSSNQFFVRQQYLDFLSREPDASGFNAWVNVLDNCANIFTGPNVSSGCDRIFVSGEGFFRSQEFRLKGYYAFRFYRLAFNRLPEYLEIVSDMSFVAGQTEAEVYARKAQLVTQIAQRPEFQAAYGGMTNAQYVSALIGRYQLTQIAAPDPTHPDDGAKVILTSTDLTNRLDAGTLSRAQVLRAMADSDEVGARELNNAFVAMQYYGYLRRTPDTAGFQAWLRVLQSGDVRTMVNGFLNSLEYKLRFGQI